MMLSYRRVTALQGAFVLAKSGRLDWETIFYVDMLVYFQPLWYNWPENWSNSVKKTQNKGYYGVQGHSRSFKVIEVGTNRKPVCDFLLLINSNRHPISYRFGVIAAYCSNFGHFAFLSPLWGLRDNVRCSFWAHWKARSGLAISVNWTFFR